MLPGPVRVDFGGLVIWRRVTVMRKWPQLICGSQSTLPKLAASTQGPMSHPPWVPGGGGGGQKRSERQQEIDDGLSSYREEEDLPQAMSPWLPEELTPKPFQGGFRKEHHHAWSFLGPVERTWCGAFYMVTGHLNRGH